MPTKSPLAELGMFYMLGTLFVGFKTWIKVERSLQEVSFQAPTGTWDVFFFGTGGTLGLLVSLI